MSIEFSEELVSVLEAAQLTHLTEVTIRRWIKSGRLPAVKSGKGYLIKVDDLQEAFSQEIDIIKESRKKELEESRKEAIRTLINELNPNIFNEEVKVALEVLKETYED